MVTMEDIESMKLDVFSEDLKELITLAPQGPPDRKNFSGAYNFAVEIDGSHTQKKKYLYSHQLNRIYVNMDTNFSVSFKLENHNDYESLFVRSTVVFSELAQAQKRVERCIQHSHKSFNNEHDEPCKIKNVLRSTRADGAGVSYCGSAEEMDSWLSVRVGLDAAQTHAYRFVCKNSCTSGINRRPIDIIFTLEDMFGCVLGRQSVGVRVCSCPRRDMLNDEKQPRAGKRALADAAPPPCKRRLRDVTDESGAVTLPAMQVYGSRTAATGVTVMINMMKQLIDPKMNPSQQLITEINRYINNLEKILERVEFIISNDQDTTK